jgi:hypothetical protein
MMNAMKLLTRFLWNNDEKRMRAVWRLGIHTLLVLILTAFFTVLLMFLVVLFDVATGASIRDVLSGSGPIQWVESPWLNMVIAPLATFLGILSATFIAGRWIDRRKFTQFGISFSKDWWIDFAFGLGLGAGLMGLIFLVGWLTGSLQVTGFFEVYQQDGGFVLGFIQALVFFVFVGIYEELLSRGYHLRNLAEGFNHPRIGERTALLLAYGLSSLVFGILHLGNPSATWVSVLNICLAGLFLGLGMVLTGSLAIPIGLHITWNFFQGNVFGFAVSGIRTGATVIATETVANTWLVGSAFGPESGFVSIIAMLLGSVLTVFWVRRKLQLRLMTDLAKYEPRTNQEGQHWQSDNPSLNGD